MNMCKYKSHLIKIKETKKMHKIENLTKTTCFFVKCQEYIIDFEFNSF